LINIIEELIAVVATVFVIGLLFSKFEN